MSSHNDTSMSIFLQMSSNEHVTLTIGEYRKTHHCLRSQRLSSANSYTRFSQWRIWDRLISYPSKAKLSEFVWNEIMKAQQQPVDSTWRCLWEKSSSSSQPTSSRVFRSSKLPTGPIFTQLCHRMFMSLFFLVAQGLAKDLSRVFQPVCNQLTI